MQTTHVTPSYDPLKDIPLEDTRQYLYEVSCIPRLAETEYQELATCMRLARAGLVDMFTGAIARERLIMAYLWKVVSIARHRFAATIEPKVSLLDLIQEGNSALVKMVDEFAFDDGTDIGGYVHTSVSWAVQQAVYASHMIRVPDSSYRYALKHGRADEVRATHSVTSLDAARTTHQKHGKTEGDETSLLHFLATPQEAARICDQIKAECLSLLFSLLAPREREALELRHGMGDDQTASTLQEIAMQMHVTPSMVCQYERRAIAHIQTIYQAYQRETGRETPYFCADRAFLAYLQKESTQDRPKPKLLPLDTPTVERLDRAYAALQSRQVKPSVRSLAKEASIASARAEHYLRLRRHITPQDATAMQRA